MWQVIRENPRAVLYAVLMHVVLLVVLVFSLDWTPKISKPAGQKIPIEAKLIDQKQLDAVAERKREEQRKAEEAKRLQALEVHPTGPLCGQGDALARGLAEQYEQDVLRACEHWIAALQRLRVSAARRALRVVPGDLRCAPDAQGIPVLEFFLPAGAYATSLLREILHPDPDR